MHDATTLCAFCEIANDRAPATIVAQWGDSLAIVPLDSCFPGHVLIIPRKHFGRPDDDPAAFGALCEKVAAFAGTGGYDYNLALNAGPDAGQTVFHVHVHLLPRKRHDGILMPWDRCGCSIP